MSRPLPLGCKGKALLLMAAFVALWAAVEAIAAGALRRYSPYQVVWTRYVVHLLFMLAIWGWSEPASLWRTRRTGLQVARSLLMLGMPACWALSMQAGVDARILVAVFWLSPLLILAFARLCLGERAGAPLWLAALAACAGAWFLAQPRLPASLSPLLFPLGMAASFSLYVVMTRSLRSESTRANLFHTAFWVALALTPFMPSLWITPSPEDLSALVGVGLLGYAGLLALDRMASAAPVSVSAPASGLQLVFAVAIAWPPGHGHVAAPTVAGLLLIVAAVVYVWAQQPGTLVRGYE